jgi:hypothetical protein
MAIAAPIFAFVGRQLGRILTTLLGWASTMLFGRVPQSRQLLLALMTFGSLAWVALLLGVLIPDVGTFLIAFVPVPDFVQERWIRLAMLFGAIVLPLFIGGAGILIPEPADRPKGLDLVKQLVRGYPLALLLAFTLAFLAVVGAVRKVRSIARRWTDAHVPMVVRPGGYGEVVDDLEDALDQAGMNVSSEAAPKVMSAPARLVGLIAGRGVGSLVPERLTLLKARDLEILVYPSDVSIAGRQGAVAQARAALATRLTATAAQLTTTKEAQELEDRIQAVANVEPHVDRAGRPIIDAEVRRELEAIDQALATLDVEYDEWEVLYRMRLQVERDLLRGHRVGEDLPGQAPAGAPAPAVGGSGPAPAGAPSMALAVLGIGVVLLDVILALLERIRPPERRPAR